MTRYTLTLLAVSLLMQSCSLIEQRPDTTPELGNDPLATAQGLAREERHGEAVELLRVAIAQGYDNARYHSALAEAEAQKKAHEQHLRDQLLLQRAHTLFREIPILERMVRSDPSNALVAKELELARDEIEMHRNRLSECGWLQQDAAPLLAKRCLSLALKLKPDEQDAQLLQKLRQKVTATLQEQEEQQRLAREQLWKSRNEERLRQARKLFETDYLLKAKEMLNRVLQEDPNNSQAIALLAQLGNRLDGYLGQLLIAGDRLYQENEIEGAIATWQAVLSLDPENEQARDKIARAQRVLDNLENLRKSQ